MLSKSGYRNQKSNNTCGPIALYNTLIWSGGTASNLDSDLRAKHNNAYTKRINFKKLCDVCKADLINGTYYDEFCKGIKYVEKISNLSITEIHPYLSDIKNQLKKNNALILMFRWTNQDVEYGYHYYLIIGMNNNGFVVVNDSMENKNSVIQISYRKMRHNLRPYQIPSFVYPKLWLVKKK